MKKGILHNIFITSILLLFFTANISAQPGELTINQDANIEKLLSLKKEMERENKLADGYTIQLYYGELSRANSIISRYRGTTGAWPASIEYETPNYKVWVGNFGTRLEADRALLEIHKTFPSAFILKPERNKN